MLAGVILLSVYFTCLAGFSFVSHPVSYCLLLLSSALSMSGYCYILIGFSWYLILFCLVYIGGVYILFIFVSVHNPNPVNGLGGSFILLPIFFFFIMCFLFFTIYFPAFNENSHYLCSYFEGLSYCFFCVVLALGFIIVSVVCSEKDSFFR
nr:NADH dehydrogenase subunit 6 [Glypthelmins sp. LW2G]